MADYAAVPVPDLVPGDVFRWAGHDATVQANRIVKFNNGYRVHALDVTVPGLTVAPLHYRSDEWVERVGSPESDEEFEQACLEKACHAIAREMFVGGWGSLNDEARLDATRYALAAVRATLETLSRRLLPDFKNEE